MHFQFQWISCWLAVGCLWLKCNWNIESAEKNKAEREKKTISKIIVLKITYFPKQLLGSVRAFTCQFGLCREDPRFLASTVASTFTTTTTSITSPSSTTFRQNRNPNRYVFKKEKKGNFRWPEHWLGMNQTSKNIIFLTKIFSRKSSKQNFVWIMPFQE